MRGKLKIALLFALLAVLAVVGYSSAGGQGSTAKDTFVFASSADPVLMDPALVSDGESLRITDQIFNSLVGFQLGGSKVVPELATSWKASPSGRDWTFTLRQGVKFSDGTPFNAAAVCFNFDRWYDFPEPLQNASVSYYWNTVFGGFAHAAQGNPGPANSLYKGCDTNGLYRVTLHLRRPSASFISAIGLPNFGIASPTALKKYNADAGNTDKSGVFHPSGAFATRYPVGTGPYMLQSWEPSVRLVLVANPRYWGPKPKITRIIYRSIADNAARLQALQTGEVQGIDYVDPASFSTVKKSKNLKLLTRPVSAVGYVGMNQKMPPMNNPLVRQAVAYALDKTSVIKTIFGSQGQAANQFLPPSLFGFAKSGVPSYPYDPAKAKAMLKKAGLTLPVKIDFWYPTDVARPYMPDPQRIFQAFQANLNAVGFSVTPHSSPWRPDYLGAYQAGKYQVYLAGWIADYFDPQDFLNVHFGAYNPQFGFTNPGLFSLLTRADTTSDPDKRTALYQQASVQVMKFLPMVPYDWAGAGTLALAKNVQGYAASPIGPVNEPWALLRYSG
jgi:peptide/nickel transport system substrate-binding protein